MFTPSVITSRAARDDLDRIRGIHEDLLTRMATQADRKNQQRQAALQSEQTMRMEMDKTKSVANTEYAKIAADSAAKQAELDVKRAALALG